MADWATISSLATAGATFVLAVATFSSVRSANRAARAAERAVLAGLRPVLSQARTNDVVQRIYWIDGHVTEIGGGRAVAEIVDGSIYIATQLRNAGQGIAVLHAWCVVPLSSARNPPADAATFRRLGRDLYVPPDDVGFWQGALRDPSEEVHGVLAAMVEARERFAIDILYGDHEGGQRTISRLGFAPEESDSWSCSVVRHWYLDREDPR